jgi:SOS-response transcriptional repressor LexA
MSTVAPLFSEGEMIFVDPDLEWSPGDYVIAKSLDEHQDVILLRQVKRIGRRCMLHPLNRKYDDLPLTKPEAVWGKVVRLRKNL